MKRITTTIFLSISISIGLTATPLSALSSQAEKPVPGSCPQYEPLLKKYQLPVKQFSYILWRESKCQTMAIGWNYKPGKGPQDCVLSPAKTYRFCNAVSSYDIGISQVNSTWKSVVARVCKRPRRQIIKSLTNPECNIKVAKYLYDNGGIGHWRGSSGS
jgi:hypothetical protein